MDDLIEALNIVRKYADSYELGYPTGCDHDVLFLSVDVGKISPEDLVRLEELSFVIDEEIDSLVSHRFGSC